MRPRITRHRISATVLALVVAPLVPTAAHGEEPARDPVGAEELFRQGVAAKNRNDWQTACEKFKKSFNLDPAVSTQYKIASCAEHDGKLASAWYGYQSALKMNRETRSDKRRRELEASIQAALNGMEARVPRLRIMVTPVAPGLELMRDGDSVAPSSVLGEALPVDPGEHVVLARAPGYAEQEVRVAVGEGRTVDATLTLREATRVPAATATQAPPSADAEPVTPIAASSTVAKQTEPRVPQQPQNAYLMKSGSNAPDPLAPTPADQRGQSGWTQVQTAYAVGAASVLTLVAAGYFGVRTLHYIGEMSDHKRGDTYDSGVRAPRDNAVRAQNAALVLAGVGVALGAVSVGLYVKAPRFAHENSAISVPGNCLPTLTGISLSGRW